MATIYELRLRELDKRVKETESAEELSGCDDIIAAKYRELIAKYRQVAMDAINGGKQRADELLDLRIKPAEITIRGSGIQINAGSRTVFSHTKPGTWK